MSCWCEEIRNNQGPKDYYCINCQPKAKAKGALKIKLELFKTLSLKDDRSSDEMSELNKLFLELCNWVGAENPFEAMDSTSFTPWDDEFFSSVADDFLKLQLAKEYEPKMWDLIQEKADMELIIESRKHFNSGTGNDDQTDDPILIRAINKLVEAEKKIEQVKSNYAWQRKLSTKPTPPVKKDIPNLAPGG